MSGSPNGTEGFDSKITCTASGYPTTSLITWSIDVTEQPDKYQLSSELGVASYTEVLYSLLAFSFQVFIVSFQAFVKHDPHHIVYNIGIDNKIDWTDR